MPPYKFSRSINSTKVQANLAYDGFVAKCALLSEARWTKIVINYCVECSLISVIKTRLCVSGQESRVAYKHVIKTHGCVSAAKKVVWCTSVLFTSHHVSVAKKTVWCTSVLSRHTVVCQQPRKMCSTQVCYLHEDAWSCVSGQESHLAHKCVVYRNC